MDTSVAIIGAGAIAHDHVAALTRIPGVRISYVVSTDAARAGALARHTADAVGTSDLAAVLNDPNVDAIDICTETERHARLAIAAAAHGKAVQVEKPVALSLADLDAMIAAVGHNDAALMVGQTVRFQPVNADLRQALVAGAIGRLRVLHLTWYTGHVWPHGWRGWQLDPRRSGGHPVHNGVHALDLAVWLFQARPTRVFTRAFRTFAPSMGIPDSFHMAVRFHDGSLALIELCYALRRRGDSLRRIVAIGEQGSIHHSTEGEPGLASDAAHPASASVEEAMYRQLAHWIAVLRGAAEPLVKLTEVRAVLAAALAAQQSLETGVAIEITTAEEVRHG